MSSSRKNSLKFLQGKAKFMLVDKEFAEEVEKLSKIMNTSSLDVLWTALKILKVSLGRDITVNKPGSKVEINLPQLKDYNPIINLDEENE